jgi:hypothetical protein
LSGGGPVATIVSTGPPSYGNVYYFAVDDQNVYWIDSGCSLLEMPKNGGAINYISSVDGGAECATGTTNVVVDSTSVYWGFNGSIMKATK